MSAFRCFVVAFVLCQALSACRFRERESLPSVAGAPATSPNDVSSAPVAGPFAPAGSAHVVDVPTGAARTALPTCLLTGGPDSRSALALVRAAASLAVERLHAADSGIHAGLRALEFLEASGQFNAGAGANLRLDGSTLQGDAIVMDSLGDSGTVGAVTAVLHPSKVARAVYDSQTTLLVGASADALAKELALARLQRPTPQVRRRYREQFARWKTQAAPASLLERSFPPDAKMPRVPTPGLQHPAAPAASPHPTIPHCSQNDLPRA